MEQPLVTIAIPFYNNAKTLIGAIQSVYAQTYANWELILLNDGSTDGSLALVAELSDPRVRIVDDNQNRGLVYRLNQVPDLANGKYIARMDGDDIMLPTRIAKQVALLESRPEIDLVDTGAYFIDSDGYPIAKAGLGEISHRPRDVIKKAMLIHASVVGKKSWFSANRYDPRYVRAEDYELWCRTFARSRFARVREPLYIIRGGHIDVRKYRSSMSTMRRILANYGPQMLTRGEKRVEIAKTYLKSGIYTIFGWLNMQYKLVALRGKTLDRAEVDDVCNLLRIIHQITLPVKLQ
ncbi:glycosyltransferase family 2 protein [Parapedobacter soli]|uniref:glycosyltransferase family 2 protein n=1 Tax=Parapedobacter soli TaxID=416955 RepID=UPI0021C9FDC9|nr:glycosyltransferase family 2 protein [Parapedobacter soli]